MTIKYQSSIGRNNTENTPHTPFKLADHPEFTFNSPVGLCSDRYKRIWLADTANNRLIVLDKSMTRVLKVYGEPGEEQGQFNMPFRLLHHPEKPLIYVSDLANRRIQVLQYTKNLNIKAINVFGNTGPQHEHLQGPNGLTFCEGKLCVADEFFVNKDGGGRIAIFSESGEFINDIQTISGATDPGLLWPQGISSDEQGRLYIANTGFYNIVRCDLSGNGIAFSATGTPEIEGLDVSRDVSIINNILYVPGGSANHINRYSMDGEALLPLGEFFAPIQVLAHPDNETHIIVTDPILASVSRYAVIDNAPLAMPIQITGSARNNPGQLYFVTSAITEAIRPDKTCSTPHNTSVFSGYKNPFDPFNWASNNLNFWEKSWDFFTNSPFNNWLPQSTRPKNKREDAWLLDGANHQIKRASLCQGSPKLDAQAKAESLFPLMPGALGIDAFHPCVSIPGQLAPGTALFLVTNYLSGFVSVLQYNPYLDDLVHFSFFAGFGSEPWQLKNPQGITVNDATGDIYIADSGNNRIAHWRISKNGIIGFINTYGEQGNGDGQFSGPSDVSVDQQGRLYIADQMNNRVQVLNSEGQYLYQFGKQGYGEDNDNFLLPTSIQATEEHIFINDLVNRSLKSFTHEGVFVDSFSGLGAKPNTGQLWMPYLLHADNNRLIVPDCATNQVHIYSY